MFFFKGLLRLELTQQPPTHCLFSSIVLWPNYNSQCMSYYHMTYFHKHHKKLLLLFKKAKRTEEILFKVNYAKTILVLTGSNKTQSLNLKIH